MSKILFSLVALVLMALITAPSLQAAAPWWQFQAIDTMKFSRDPSREFLRDREVLEEVTETQVKNIAETGATHVGIATPYDDEFFPVLEVWVAAARRHNLKVWFRGNWSGWESWFGYQKITREQHLQKTVEFVKDHPGLFENGDVFSACPECENGGPGDPRLNGDAAGHRQFLIAEYQALSQAFADHELDVAVNYNSMNGDVARLIMDQPTTKALGGLVVVDHYVRTPERLNLDVTDLAQRSGGKVVLGEFGAPIPDINGNMTEAQQAEWLDNSLKLLSTNPNLVGLSYWTNVGGSTAIWNEDKTPRLAVGVLTNYYSPEHVTVTVTNPLGDPLSSAQLSSNSRTVVESDGKGTFTWPFIDTNSKVLIVASGHTSQELSVAQLQANPVVVLQPTQIDFWYWLRQKISQIFS